MIEQHIIVLGAGGKMGRGISLLLLQMLAAQRAIHSENKEIKLFLVEANEEKHLPLKVYLKEQIQRYAEKEINKVRGWFSYHENLVSNSDIVNAFVGGAMEIIHFLTRCDICVKEAIVFEAVMEDVDVKVNLFKELEKISPGHFYYLTNTSSIPIHLLEEKAGIKGRIIGFHFYNPPPVQKLVELIIPTDTDSHLVSLAETLGKCLNKHLVPSNDIAGFIGNGYMVREIYHACTLVEQLEGDLEDNIWLVDTVYRDYLLRPMGIFQLIDYVGIDICHHIAKIMETYLQGEKFLPPLIDKMVNAGILGGQDDNGKQKNGFFSYHQDKIAGIYSLKTGTYLPLDDKKTERLKNLLGEKPAGWIPWKQLLRANQRDEKIKAYFKQLPLQKELGAEMAVKALHHVNKIVELLVQKEVSQRPEHVGQVLKDGFFHLYAPSEVL